MPVILLGLVLQLLQFLHKIGAGLFQPEVESYVQLVRFFPTPSAGVGLQFAVELRQVTLLYTALGLMQDRCSIALRQGLMRNTLTEIKEIYLLEVVSH